MNTYNLRILETSIELAATEELQRLVWPGSDMEVVPAHLLLAAVHSGGLVIGAYPDNEPDHLIAFVFSFPGFYPTPDGPRLKQHSHMLATHPDYRDQGVGFLLKRAQWQMVRHQGIDRVTWTYDPLLSRNAHLNIARLGAVCTTYIPDYYGPMYDLLNVGLPTDRLLVDWWVNTRRVAQRLSKRPRPTLTPLDFRLAGARYVPFEGQPPSETDTPAPLVLVEIPNDFQALRVADPSTALAWRLHMRQACQALFAQGYWITDFVHQTAPQPQSFYVFSHGEAVL